MDDTISRQAAIRWVKTECNPYGKPTLDFESGKKVIEHLAQMSTIDLLGQTVYEYSIRFLVYVASVMAKKGITAEQAAEIVTDMRAFVSFFCEEQKEITRKALEEIGKGQKSYTDWELRRE